MRWCGSLRGRSPAISGFRRREEIAHADYVATPATRLAAGADVRVEGTMVDGPTTTSPFAQQKCLAAVTDVSVWTRYRDIHDRPTAITRAPSSFDEHVIVPAATEA